MCLLTENFAKVNVSIFYKSYMCLWIYFGLLFYFINCRGLLQLGRGISVAGTCQYLGPRLSCKILVLMFCLIQSLTRWSYNWTPALHRATLASYSQNYSSEHSDMYAKPPITATTRYCNTCKRKGCKINAEIVRTIILNIVRTIYIEDYLPYLQKSSSDSCLKTIDWS